MSEMEIKLTLIITLFDTNYGFLISYFCCLFIMFLLILYFINHHPIITLYIPIQTMMKSVQG